MIDIEAQTMIQTMVALSIASILAILILYVLCSCIRNIIDGFRLKDGWMVFGSILMISVICGPIFIILKMLRCF